MKRRLPFALGLLAVAAARADEVEVALVHFANIRPPTGTNPWYEADVAIEAKPVAGPTHMVSRVRVALTLAFELPATTPGGERHIEYYRAEAECAALDPGRADVRFYLPAEIVKRDQLHGDPRFWTVDLTVAGRALPASRAGAVATLASPDARRTFGQKAAAGAAANDGLLQPQYLTPFAGEYPRNTPSFVRRDPR